MATTIDAAHLQNGNNDLSFADRMLRSVIPIAAVVAGACALYYGVAGKIDRLADEVAALRVEMKQSLKSDDLRLFCAQAQIANRGWTCPLIEQPKATTVRTIPVKPANH